MMKRILAVAAAFAFTLVASRAHAAFSDNTVSLIEYQPDVLVVQLTGGANFHAFKTAPTGCNSRSIDTIKAWQSLAQSALLAGKKVRIYYTVCNSQNMIDIIDLNK